MAESGQASAPKAPLLKINIDDQYTSDVKNGNVDDGGAVKFKCHPKGGAWVYTDPPDAFKGETNGYLTLSQGDNRPFTPSDDDFTITYCCCAPGPNARQEDQACTQSRLAIR